MITLQMDVESWFAHDHRNHDHDLLHDDHHNGGSAHPDNVQREVAESVKDDHHYQHFYKLKITIILMLVLMKILMTIMMMTVLKVLIIAKMPE